MNGFIWSAHTLRLSYLYISIIIIIFIIGLFKPKQIKFEKKEDVVDDDDTAIKAN